MKVYEVMAKLAEVEAGAEVRVARAFDEAEVDRLADYKECASYDGAVIEIEADGAAVYIKGGESI